MNKVQVIGTGSYAPERIVTNEELSQIVDTSNEWISSRTGILERRISEGEDTSEMATKAALKAIEMANIKPEEIDLLIVATLTPDCFTPSVACMVQGNINAVNATCFDISAACTGFIYGITVASQFIATGAAKTVLVVGAETMSKVLNWKDRNTCVLFGDGAGAAVLTASDKGGILATYTGAEGSKGCVLTCGAAPVENPYLKEATEFIPENYKVQMDGKEVFKFAVKVMSKGIKKLLEDSKLSIDDIKYIVPHQANSRIIEAAAKKVGVSEEKFFVNLHKYGNTSGASIALALDEMVQQGLLQRGDKILFMGFGAGLTYGGLILEW